jgi:MSHA biogenesis protein MshQ
MDRAALKPAPRRGPGWGWLLALAGLLVLATPAFAQVALLSSASARTSSAADTSLALPRPSGSGSNVLLIATLALRGGSSTTLTPPAGWTLVNRRDLGTNLTLASYRSLAASLGSEPASYTFSFTAGHVAATVMAFTGADTASPVGDLATQADSNVSSIDAPNITVPVANSRLLAVYATRAADTAIGTPSGMSAVLSENAGSGTGGVRLAAFTLSPVAAGGTSGRTATLSPAVDAVGLQLSLTPATLPLFLRATGVPDSSLSTAAPTAATLADHDPGRDNFPGLLLAKGGAGADEGDDTKHQRWLGSTGGLTLSGPLELRVWTAIKDFETTKTGALTAFLRSCNSSGGSCTLLATASLTQGPWSASGNWTQKTLSFGTVNATLASNRRLELKLIVPDASDDDLWLAYDSTAYASALGPPVATVSINHYQVQLPSTSISCAASTVTVTACADASSPCTSPATTVNGQTATLATSAGTLASTSLVFNSAGVASTTLSHPAAADGSSVSVTLSGESTAASQPRRCCPDGASCSAANSCATTFRTAGFIFAATSNGAGTTLPAQTAGTASASYFLRAVRTGTSTQACEAALTGAQNVDWGYECLNPGTCASSNLLQVNGGTATTVARNNSGSSSSRTAVAMTFDSAGSAPFTFTHADVGQLRLHASRAVGGATLSGSSNSMVVRPARFALSDIRQTASPNTANPGASNAAGARFIAAGEAFSATLTAQTSTGATAPSFGRESPAEGVLLSATLVQPSGGTAGTLSNATIAGASFSSGVATATTLAYSEVGIVTLTPAVADGDYLGAGAVSGTASGNVGRFVPARFAVSGGSVTHRSGLACSPASSFSHLGENFRLGLTLTAQNTSGATTTNYQGDFAKLAPGTASGWRLAGISSGNVFTVDNARLSLGSSSGSWAAGVLAATLTAQVTRPGTPEGPHDASFGVAPVDSDGVATTGLNLATTAPFTTSDRASVATVALRHGRLRLASAIGPADRPLALPLSAQFWNGSAWAPNTLDSCTAVPATALNFGALSGTLTTADTAALGTVTLNEGRAQLRLAAPGGGRRGSYSVALSLGASAADNSCLQPWSPGTGDAATAGAQLGFLRGAWCGSSSDHDPAARASFGRASSDGHLVFRQENP